MTEKKLKVVHYLNQFFGQVGGEEKADIGFMVKSGPLGPGLALQKALGNKADVMATIICGDNTFSKNPEVSAEEGFKLIEPYHPDLFFAGQLLLQEGMGSPVALSVRRSVKNSASRSLQGCMRKTPVWRCTGNMPLSAKPGTVPVA